MSISRVRERARAGGRARRILAGAAVLVLLGALDQFAAWRFYQDAARRYAAPLPGRVDAAVVLFSGMDPHGRPDAETTRRLAHAAALYASPGVAAVSPTGGGRSDPSRPAEAGMVRALLARGVSPEAIVPEPLSHDTVTNVEYAMALARARGWRSIVFVSSPVHLVRVQRLVQGEARDKTSTIRVFFSAYPWQRANPPVSWCDRSRQVHHEWIAEALAWMLGQARYREWIARWRGLEPAALR